MIRLYFNKHGEKPWSSDHGQGTKESTWSEVIFMQSECVTVYAPEAGDDKDTPTAWIEIRGGTVKFIL